MRDVDLTLTLSCLPLFATARLIAVSRLRTIGMNARRSRGICPTLISAITAPLSSLTFPAHQTGITSSPTSHFKMVANSSYNPTSHLLTKKAARSHCNLPAPAI